MKSRILPVLLLLVFLISHLKAWDSTAAKFYPLAVGNAWSYHYKTYQPPNGCTVPVSEYNIIISIISDTLLPNGHRYFKFSDGYHLERIDSNTMNVYRWNGADYIYDSLLARINNSYRTYRYNLGQVMVCDTLSINFGGQLRKTKGICTVGGGWRLMVGIGYYGSSFCEVQSGWLQTLNGCIINGIQYGQMLGLITLSNEIPHAFKLYQNYPNPFNPVTKIKFDVSASPLSFGEGSGVRLLIYDILGREVRTLVNGNLKPGTYEVDFDASDLPTGMYFYSLLVDENLIDTKKSVLIK